MMLIKKVSSDHLSLAALFVKKYVVHVLSNSIYGINQFYLLHIYFSMQDFISVARNGETRFMEALTMAFSLSVLGLIFLLTILYKFLKENLIAKK